MVLDVHAHICKNPSQRALQYARSNKIDFTRKGMLKEMKTAGVDNALILASNRRGWDGFGGSNEEVLEISRASEGKFFPVATVDPTVGRRALEKDLNFIEKNLDVFKGIKLRPGYLFFYPNDLICQGVYEFADKYNTPILIHTGDTAIPKAKLKYAHPLHIDDVAPSYPDIGFVLCHFGNPWVEEAAEVAFKNENVFLDTSGLFSPFPPSAYSQEYFKAISSRVSRAIYYLGSCEKVLYGSDWPIVPFQLAIRFINSLKIKNEDKEKVLSLNAGKVFRV